MTYRTIPLGTNGTSRPQYLQFFRRWGHKNSAEIIVTERPSTKVAIWSYKNIEHFKRFLHWNQWSYAESIAKIWRQQNVFKPPVPSVAVRSKAVVLLLLICSSRWGRDIWLLYYNWLLSVTLLLLFCVCSGAVGWWRREIWLLYYSWLLTVTWLLLFCVSSFWCRGLVCIVWLGYFWSYLLMLWEKYLLGYSLQKSLIKFDPSKTCPTGEHDLSELKKIFGTN